MGNGSDSSSVSGNQSIVDDDHAAQQQEAARRRRHRFNKTETMMGALSVQAGVLVHNTSGDGSWSLQWSTLWRRSGDRGEEWAYARVELPPATERVRFLGKTGFHYRSDMAIDDVLITQTTPMPT